MIAPLRRLAGKLPPDFASDLRLDFRGRFGALLLYYLFFAAVAAVALAPAMAWMAMHLVTATGQLAISNEEIVRFLTSPRGVLWMLVAASSAGALLFAQHGGLMLVARGRNAEGGPVSSAAALWTILRRFRDVFELGARHVLAHLLILVPFAAAAGVVYRIFLSGYDLNYLVTTRPPAWWWTLGFLLLLGIGILLANGGLYLRWSLSVPSLLLGGLRPRDAIREGRRLYHVAEPGFRVAVAAGGLGLLFLPGLVNALFLVFAETVLDLVTRPMALVAAVSVLLLGLHLAVTVLAGFLAVTLNALTLARLYSAGPVETPGAATGAPARLRGFGAATWGALLLGLTLSVLVAGLGLSRVTFRETVEITAHRGSSLKAPENTLSAIRQAIEDGADYAEIDVQETADGVVVLFHDQDFMRFARSPAKLRALSLDEVRAQDVGAWFDPAFAGEGVPTLAEAIALAKGRIKLNIELKTYGDEQELPERVAAELRRESFVDQALVTSLNLDLLRRVKAADASVATGYVLARTIGHPSRIETDVLSVSAAIATPAFIASAQHAGKEVHVWTVNLPDEMTRLIDYGADNLITDRPEVLATLLRERADLPPEARLALKVRSLLYE